MLTAALLCRNEATKDLKLVLNRLAKTCDQVLVLDDGSEDDSVKVAQSCGATVKIRQGPAMWGQEAPARAELWDWGAREARDGWLLIADCDMLLEGDPRPYCRSDWVNTWSFVLYDLWNSPTTYRCDGYWQAHTVPRPWLFCPSRVPVSWVPQWPDRGIHTGHCPMNWPAMGGLAGELAWHHTAYLDKPRRDRKLQQYLAKSAHLSPFELAHARSIGDS